MLKQYIAKPFFYCILGSLFLSFSPGSQQQQLSSATHQNIPPGISIGPPSNPHEENPASSHQDAQGQTSQKNDESYRSQWTGKEEVAKAATSDYSKRRHVRMSNWDYKSNWRSHRKEYFKGKTQPEVYRQNHPYGYAIGYDIKKKLKTTNNQSIAYATSQENRLQKPINQNPSYSYKPNQIQNHADKGLSSSYTHGQLKNNDRNNTDALKNNHAFYHQNLSHHHDHFDQNMNHNDVYRGYVDAHHESANFHYPNSYSYPIHSWDHHQDDLHHSYHPSDAYFHTEPTYQMHSPYFSHSSSSYFYDHGNKKSDSH